MLLSFTPDFTQPRRIRFRAIYQGGYYEIECQGERWYARFYRDRSLFAVGHQLSFADHAAAESAAESDALGRAKKVLQ